MVTSLRVALVGFAFLPGGFAFRRQHANRSLVADPSVKSCNIVGPVGEAMRQAANFALKEALKGKSPLNVTLHAGRYDIPIQGCVVGMGVDFSVRLAGFEDTQIESFGCNQEGDTMTLSSRVVFGQSVETAGAFRGNWSMCGVRYPNETGIRVGVFHTDPGLKVAIKLKKTPIPFLWVISEIKTLEIEHGGFDGLTCALSGIPEFIGKPAEEWCEKIIKWLADKLAEMLQGDTQNILLNLIGKDVKENCDAQYDCNCDGGKNCGSWDYFGIRCRNLDQCSFQWRFGDIFLDQKCRCK